MGTFAWSESSTHLQSSSIFFTSCILDDVNMYFPIGSFRKFALPVEDPQEIVFIRATRDRLKLVVLSPTIISIWLTKVIFDDDPHDLLDCLLVSANSLSGPSSTLRKFDFYSWWKFLRWMAERHTKTIRRGKKNQTLKENKYSDQIHFSLSFLDN